MLLLSGGGRRGQPAGECEGGNISIYMPNNCINNYHLCCREVDGAGGKGGVKSSACRVRCTTEVALVTESSSMR